MTGSFVALLLILAAVAMFAIVGTVVLVIRDGRGQSRWKVGPALDRGKPAELAVLPDPLLGQLHVTAHATAVKRLVAAIAGEWRVLAAIVANGVSGGDRLAYQRAAHSQRLLPRPPRAVVAAQVPEGRGAPCGDPSSSKNSTLART